MLWWFFFFLACASVLRSHSTAWPSAQWRARRPPSHGVSGHSSTMCDIVWMLASGAEWIVLDAPLLEARRSTCHDQCGSGWVRPISERTKSNPGGRTDGSVTMKPFQIIWSDQSSFQQDKEENSTAMWDGCQIGCLDRRRTLGTLNRSSKAGRLPEMHKICPITLEIASWRPKLAPTMLLRILSATVVDWNAGFPWSSSASCSAGRRPG